MKQTRRRWGAALGALVAAALLCAPGATGAAAPDTVTFMLDWFPNPDHVPLYAAVGLGYFTQAGLHVNLQVPANADDPLKLVAVGRADVGVNYEPSVIMARAQTLPVKSIGVLIGQPLTTIMFLKSSGIRTPKDLVGRRVGFAVNGYEDALVDQIVRSDGASVSNLTMINVGFDLVPALLSHKIDAVVGAYRNVERIQIEQQGQAVAMFEPERYGVPTFYELVLIAGDRQIATRPAVLRRFVGAVARGIAFTEAHPQDAFQQYVRLNPSLNDAFNRASFQATLPTYARTQTESAARWTAFDQWMAAHKVIPAPVPVDDLYVNLLP
jgi:putative hydroxymethylpyrimidine transport system substrate-binding protein